MKEVSCKVLLYLKRSSLTAFGQAPIMCRVTVGRSMVQLSSKLTRTPALWNVRERRLIGKSREAVETNARIEKLLLGIHETVKSLSSRPGRVDAEAVKCQYQSSLEIRMPLLRLLYGPLLCGCRAPDRGEPLYGRIGHPVAQVPEEEDRLQGSRIARGRPLFLSRLPVHLTAS